MYKIEYSREPGDLVEKVAKYKTWKGDRYSDVYCPVCHGIHNSRQEKFHVPHQRSWKEHTVPSSNKHLLANILTIMDHLHA